MKNLIFLSLVLALISSCTKDNSNTLDEQPKQIEDLTMNDFVKSFQTDFNLSTITGEYSSIYIDFEYDQINNKISNVIYKEIEEGINERVDRTVESYAVGQAVGQAIFGKSDVTSRRSVGATVSCSGGSQDGASTKCYSQECVGEAVQLCYDGGGCSTVCHSSILYIPKLNTIIIGYIAPNI